MGSGIEPKFNDWAFSNAGFVDTRASVQFRTEVKGEKALIADAGVVPEGTMGTLVIRLTGTISAATNAAARDDWSLLLKNLRGTDRVKKGRLDLHGDGYHYFCQLVDATPFEVIAGTGNLSATLVFECDEPYRRANTLVTYSEVVSVSDPVLVLNYGSAFSGDAWRIPIVIKPTTGVAWAKNDMVRVYNSTIGWRFEHVLTQALSVGQPLVLDGEVGEVLENGAPVGEGNAGGGLYIRGGVTNTLTFSGTTLSRLTGSWTVELYDRFVG